MSSPLPPSSDDTKIVRETEGGQSWAELAELDPLQAVLDPADRRGGKNRLIDRVHKLALSRSVGDLRGKRVLDFGCGTGRLSGWLVQRGALVEGVDVTKEMVDVARRRVPQAPFRVIDGRNLPFGDGQFELVVTAYVLQYYLDGDGAIVRELARVLRHGGRLVAVEQVTDDDIGRGGPVAAYRRTLVAAGFDAVAASMIRLGDSVFIGAAQRHPRLSTLPFVPRLVMTEAAWSRRPLTGGRYADGLLQALKP